MARTPTSASKPTDYPPERSPVLAGPNSATRTGSAQPRLRRSETRTIDTEDHDCEAIERALDGLASSWLRSLPKVGVWNQLPQRNRLTFARIAVVAVYVLTFGEASGSVHLRPLLRYSRWQPR
jgi:hypothetical protein